MDAVGATRGLYANLNTDDRRCVGSVDGMRDSEAGGGHGSQDGLTQCLYSPWSHCIGPRTLAAGMTDTSVGLAIAGSFSPDHLSLSHGQTISAVLDCSTG